MKKNDMELLKKASAILDKEGWRDVYNGDEARIFDNAQIFLKQAIDKAISRLEDSDGTPSRLQERKRKK